MKKNVQLIFNKWNGDCLRACITSILGIENSENLPNIDSHDWFVKWLNILMPCGIFPVYETKAFWRQGYWIASVKSKNFPDTTHAIVMNGSKVWFDPSTKEKYSEGEDLLGSDAVSGGFFFEVIDFSKLENLKNLK